MTGRSFIIKYVSVKDSFVYVANRTKVFNIGSYIKLTSGDNYVGYFSVNHTPIDLGHNAIGIGSMYGKILGLNENDSVTITEVTSLPTVVSLVIAPLMKNDYEVLELLSEEIQDKLLQQIKVVYLGQIFIIWVGENINVAVCVDNINSLSFGKLEFLTELHINPELNTTTTTYSIDNRYDQLYKYQVSLTNPEWIKHLLNNDITQDDGLKDFYEIGQGSHYRIIPITVLPELKLGKYNKISDAILSKNHAPADWPSESLATPIYCSITLLTNEDSLPKTVYVRLIYFEDIHIKCDPLNYKHIYLNNIILDYFNGRIGSRAVLRLMHILPVVKEIEIRCRKNRLSNVVHLFKAYLSQFSDDRWVLNRNLPINIGDNIICELNFLPTGSEFCIVDDNLLRDCEYHVNEENVTTIQKHEPATDKMFVETVGSYCSMLDSCSKIYCNSSSVMENILILGKSGSGKSSIMKMLTRMLKKYPYLMNVELINCKSIKGKTMDSILKLFQNTLDQLVLHQPSILMLDDLDVLCEHSKGEDTAPNNIYFDRVSELLHNIFKLFCAKHEIGICATGKSIETINKNIYSSRGSHLFKNVYSINELNKDDRVHILEELFLRYKLENIDFTDLAPKIDGFVFEDMINFFNKTVFEAAKNDSSKRDPIQINLEDCERALKTTISLALENIKLHKCGDKDFTDIGGLEEVKVTLTENLLWPAKYSSIFSNTPLRLQSGLLLYGPPGTGKTVLAAAAAKHCGLRLISVKGPELLSKYIGASEQAVRDIFEKAQSVKPCILFFDEFDSLAPRRGHDNTGVTDRVVNQLLTQLDGVEVLTGVCVLAATSRPDLLDPALLRPGRLDRQILCDLPSKDDRFSILKALSKNLELDSAVNFEEIAASTAYFSGADLQSLLYTAQLSTIEHILKGEQNASTFESVIAQEHLIGALKKTKPSLTRQERLKYERIYQKFRSGTTVEDFEAGTKATLA